MKKYLTILTCCASVGIAMNVSLQFQSDGNKAEITLVNIEALAQGEDTSEKCWFQGSVDCPHSTIKVMYLQ
ncbi:MAG TPA: NVEALA domain-containing protein [Sphingobacterium sp.]|nr:NVEALA domain-containing protein [Sphingobacterium sp.]